MLPNVVYVTDSLFPYFLAIEVTDKITYVLVFNYSYLVFDYNVLVTLFRSRLCDSVDGREANVVQETQNYNEKNP